MRLPVLTALLAVHAWSASAQITAGVSAGYLFSNAPGIRAGCGRSAAVTADAWAARPLEPSGRLSALVVARWARPLKDACVAIGTPLPPRPDGVYVTTTYGTPWFASDFGTLEGRLQFAPWPRAAVRPRLLGGGGWAMRLDAGDQPFVLGGIGLGFPIGTARVAWDLEVWWLRVERQLLSETWRNSQPVAFDVLTTDRAWRRAVAVRLTLEDLF
jgi:hypothetical protein